ncbi:hypothetical protein Bca4012_018538 [Brassica carinata]
MGIRLNEIKDNMIKGRGTTTPLLRIWNIIATTDLTEANRRNNLRLASVGFREVEVAAKLCNLLDVLNSLSCFAFNHHRWSLIALEI